MKNKFTLNILAASTLFNSTALAEVDLSQGSFSYSETAQSLVMIYNSRSLHQGLLGFGWCSPLEDSLDVANSGSVLRLRDCRAGKIISFKLKANALRAPSSTTQIYESGDSQILSSETQFKLIHALGSIQTFDRNGRLLEVKDERGKSARLLYDKNGFLKEVISGRKDSLTLKVDPRNGRLVEANHQGARTRLTFLKGNLISVIKPRTAKYFTYDQVSNLIEVTDLKKITSVTYDSHDRVTSVRTSPECTETYSYTQLEKKERTEVMTNCRGINNKRLVDFFYSRGSSGEVLLEKISSQQLKLPSSRLPATYETN